jgi:E3 ubiquitin-protein ligase BAH
VILDYSSEKCLHVQVHRSREGGLFKSRLMAMRSELLKSPCLVELGALHLNLADAKEDTVMSDSELVAEFSCDFESSSPTLACTICLVYISGLPFAITRCVSLVVHPTALFK